MVFEEIMNCSAGAKVGNQVFKHQRPQLMAIVGNSVKAQRGMIICQVSHVEVKVLKVWCHFE
jgi:hypothetical protein